MTDDEWWLASAATGQGIRKPIVRDALLIRVHPRMPVTRRLVIGMANGRFPGNMVF
jgi:hypothetical protein